MANAPYETGDELAMYIMTQTDGEERLTFPVTGCMPRETESDFRWNVSWADGPVLHTAAVDDSGTDASGQVRPVRRR